jgi:predicted Zn finger-like uncharacterized protein
MLKVECEKCKAPYQVDERRVPPTGQKMRCPKCGHTFTVMAPGAPQAEPPRKATILGVAISPSGPVPTAVQPAAGAAPVPLAKPVARPPDIAPLPDAPGLGDIDELNDLPAISPAGLPAAVKPLPAINPTLMSRQDPAGKHLPPVPSPFDDAEIDLPSPTADLPAAKGGAPGGKAGHDLPAVKPAAKPPAGGAGMTFDVDLPSAAARPADLPARKAPPPVPKRPPPPPPAKGQPADLPAKREEAGLPAVFGDVGLPAVFGGVGLPSPAQGGGFGSVDLPSVGGGVGLPVPSAGVGLPVASAGTGLPATVDQDRYLPRAAGADAHLPTAARPDAHLPAVADAFPAVFGGGALPSTDTGSAPVDFGEALFGDVENLPPLPPRTPAGSSPPAGRPASVSPPPPPPQQSAQPVPGGTGGVGFGELDFGGSAGGEEFAVDGKTGAPSMPPAEVGAEVPVPTTDMPPPPKARDRVVIQKGQGRAPKIVLAGIIAAVVAGALLTFTDYGAFGFKAINDQVHKTEWAAAATNDMGVARKAIGADLYDQCRSAADTIANQSAALPRARALIAAAALTEYEFQTRFGRDASRATRADSWLKSIAAVTGNPASIMYYSAAVGGRAAATGDLAGARGLLEAASLKDTGDPVQQDIALLRGEIELKAKDAAAATKAFTRALQVAPSAHAHYGLARAYDLAGDKAKAQAELAATLAATPKHPGAMVLKARLDWGEDRNDAAVIAELNPLLDGPAKATASPTELSQAYTVFGLAQAGRGDVGAARTAFESALKLDSGNVDALIGQGEVFFSDGRYTEALSRFDTAVQADPTNPTAIVADAKAKMQLDRLADAKNQLAAAQKAMPKVMIVTYWLGRVEELLGDKKGAEDAYVAAIAATSAKDRDAIQPYVALSTLLAAQGRAAEAQARLSEARSKLPDSGAMQRALGEVATAQGLFEEAVGHYQTAVAKDPHDLRSQFLLGETFLRMRRYDDATAQFDKVATADPDYPNLAMRRGELLEASGHIVQALEQFKAALAKAPKDLDMQLRVGAAYVGAGRGEEGLATLKPVYDVRQNSAEVNHYLGRAHLLLGGTAHLGEAMRFLQKAVDIDPTRAEYHLYLAWAATDSQDWKLGKSEVDKALGLDQLLGDAYWQRAVIEEIHGEVDTAIQDALKALQLHPARDEAHATLAKCYADKNQPDKALAEWAIATSRVADRPDWEFLYGRLLYDQGNFAGALAHVLVAAKAAEAANPAPGWAGKAEFLAAECLRKKGENVDAKEHYIRYLDRGERSSPDYKDAMAALRSIDPSYTQH